MNILLKFADLFTAQSKFTFNLIYELTSASKFGLVFCLDTCLQLMDNTSSK